MADAPEITLCPFFPYNECLSHPCRFILICVWPRRSDGFPGCDIWSVGITRYTVAFPDLSLRPSVLRGGDF